MGTRAPGPHFPLILFVDDNKECLIVAEAYLALYGFDVIPASSAGEALEIIAHETVDVVVTDFEMPGTNGLELAAFIKHSHPYLPVFIRSGSLGPDQMTQCNVNGWFLKSDPFSVLLNSLRDCISSPPFPAREPLRDRTKKEKH